MDDLRKIQIFNDLITAECEMRSRGDLYVYLHNELKMTNEEIESEGFDLKEYWE